MKGLSAIYPISPDLGSGRTLFCHNYCDYPQRSPIVTIVTNLLWRHCCTRTVFCLLCASIPTTISPITLPPTLPASGFSTGRSLVSFGLVVQIGSAFPRPHSRSSIRPTFRPFHLPPAADPFGPLPFYYHATEASVDFPMPLCPPERVLQAPRSPSAVLQHVTTFHTLNTPTNVISTRNGISRITLLVCHL